MEEAVGQCVIQFTAKESHDIRDAVILRAAGASSEQRDGYKS